MRKRREVDIVRCILRAAKRLPGVNTVWQLKRKTSLDYGVLLKWLEIFEVIANAGVLPVPVQTVYKAFRKAKAPRRYLLCTLRVEPTRNIPNKR